jgi:hypothetical protein
MKKKILAGLTIGLFMFVMGGMAQASTFQVSFVASNFSPPGAPVDPVTGSIWYVAASATAPIEAITQVDLSIAGHVYGLSEVGFVSSPGSYQAIGGIPDGVMSLLFVVPWHHYVDDFMLMWSLVTSDMAFLYTVPFGGDVWTSVEFDRFSIVEQAAVPIPGAVYLFASGLIGLAGFRRKFKKQ